jgi:hypothetical protein
MAPAMAIEVASWLKQLGLEQYEQAFRGNEVDGDLLPHLTAEDLIGLGVTLIGHRRKLLLAIAALGAEAPTPVRLPTSCSRSVRLRLPQTYGGSDRRSTAPRKLRSGGVAHGHTVNRMKAALVRLGIRGFNPKLRKAPQQLADLRTPEGGSIPPNTLAELQREMAHLRFISEQIPLTIWALGHFAIAAR